MSELHGELPLAESVEWLAAGSEWVADWDEAARDLGLWLGEWRLRPDDIEKSHLRAAVHVRFYDGPEPDPEDDLEFVNNVALEVCPRIVELYRLLRAPKCSCIHALRVSGLEAVQHMRRYPSDDRLQRFSALSQRAAAENELIRESGIFLTEDFEHLTAPHQALYNHNSGNHETCSLFCLKDGDRQAIALELLSVGIPLATLLARCRFGIFAYDHGTSVVVLTGEEGVEERMRGMGGNS